MLYCNTNKRKELYLDVKAGMCDSTQNEMFWETSLWKRTKEQHCGFQRAPPTVVLTQEDNA